MGEIFLNQREVLVAQRLAVLEEQVALLKQALEDAEIPIPEPETEG